MDSSSHDDRFSGTARLSRRTALRGLGVGGLAAAAATAAIDRARAAPVRSDLQATPTVEPEVCPMQLVYRFESRFTDLVPIGLVPEGIRLDAHFTGTVVEGQFLGGTVTGIDYGLIRADGVEQLNVRGIITTPANQLISIQVFGYVIPPAGMQFPPLEELLRPDFVWPDIEQSVPGFALYQTGATDLAWLNRTVLAIEGTANPGTGTLVITAYAFSPIPEPGTA